MNKEDPKVCEVEVLFCCPNRVDEGCEIVIAGAPKRPPPPPAPDPAPTEEFCCCGDPRPPKRLPEACGLDCPPKFEKREDCCWGCELLMFPKGPPDCAGWDCCVDAADVRKLPNRLIIADLLRRSTSSEGQAWWLKLRVPLFASPGRREITLIVPLN